MSLSGAEETWRARRMALYQAGDVEIMITSSIATIWKRRSEDKVMATSLLKEQN